MQTMALAPEVAHAHFALATQAALAYIDQYTALGIEQIGIGGDFSGTRPLISPRMYRAFIVPHLHRLSERIHAAGAYAVNASDGDLWPVIDDFLIASGVDGYLEIDLHAGMDLRRLKAAYGSRITFYGNLDCGIELSFGTPEAVRQHTLDCLEAGWGQGGHILCASNAITASIPLANYLAAVNAYREVFALERLKLP
jgi:uroporphyrinogen-III decarboxylase